MLRKLHRSAFTLIELLVVIAIIAILAALLFPALGKARELAQRSVCLGNLRNIAVGIQSYTSEHDGSYPAGQVYVGSTLQIWWFVVQPYMGGPVSNVKSALNCQTVHECRKKETGSDLQWPNYGINPFIGGNPWNEANRPNPMRVLSVRKLSKTMLVMDGDWNQSSPLALITLASTDAHAGGRNILFADSHAQWWNNAKSLNATPYCKNGAEDVWTP